MSSSPGAEPTEAEWAALLAKKRRIEEWERQIADEKTQFYGEVKEMLARLPAVGGRGVAAEKLGMKKETVRWIDQLDLASRIRRLGRRKDT